MDDVYRLLALNHDSRICYYILVLLSVLLLTTDRGHE